MAWIHFIRSDHDRTSLRYTSDMSDGEFAQIAAHLPGQPKRGRKRRVCLRSVISGIFYVLQNGCAWANLPKDFPPKSTVYGYFRRFLEDGTWAGIHDALYVDCRDLEGREPQPSAAIIDSQSIKTGTNAREDVGYDAPLSDALHRLPAMGKKDERTQAPYLGRYGGFVAARRCALGRHTGP